MSEKYPNGLRFHRRGRLDLGDARQRRARPAPGSFAGPQALDASDRRILATASGTANRRHLHASPQNDHHLELAHRAYAPARTRRAGGVVTVVERVPISDAATASGRDLRWTRNERFLNNQEANRILSRKQRRPYGTNYVA